uniref:Small ribosomal subunit protein eS8 n=1 Tax=Thermofilum pendens TaxID=2269 RepID=A0A7C4B8J0_THEPE
MGVYHGNDLRKITGGVKGRHVKVKRKYWMGRYPTLTAIGEKNVVKVIRTKGGGRKVRLKVVAEANVYVPKEGKTLKTKVIKLLDNPADRNLARRGIVTKGAIVQTSLGKAVVTSRPGQDGVLNAVLIE